MDDKNCQNLPSDRQGHNVTKISTGIDGLDKLFFGGIQLQQEQNESHDKERTSDRGLIIAIRGERGIDKTLTAMQMMHGLTKSLEKGEVSSCFYSINKSTKQLSDMLLDILITKQSFKLIEEYINDEKGMPFSDVLFDITEEGLKRLEYFRGKSGCTLESLIAEETVYYNNRTNALHFRQPGTQDNDKNFLFYRRGNFIEEIIKDNDKLDEGYQKEFFEVDINPHETGQNNNSGNSYGNEYFSCTSLQILEKILNHIEEKRLSNDLCPCLVIDGITQLRSKEFDSVNFTHLEMLLRKCARISIMVFDETEDTSKCNADIVVRMRRIEGKENYTYHQLCIEKSVFQQVAYGWHQYKKRDYGIEVYPSTHLLLQKRRHMPQIKLNSHLCVVEELYRQYLERIKGTEDNDGVCGKEDISYSTYINGKDQREIDLVEKLIAEKLKKRSIVDILNDIFSPSQQNIEAEKEGCVTALIGETNSFKKFLTMGNIFGMSRQEKHSLFTLLDEEEALVLRQMQCPGISEGCNSGKCIGCYRYIHFFPIRMGCISSDELFYYLQKQIELSDRIPKNKIYNLVFDDLQKIDFSFPLLRNEKLFLSGLIALCKKLRLRVFILCDRHASLAQELRALADNVVFIQRNGNYPAVDICVEHTFGYHDPSKYYACHIPDIQHVFRCTDSSLEWTLEAEEYEEIEINTLEQFWRRTEAS